MFCCKKPYSIAQIMWHGPVWTIHIVVHVSIIFWIHSIGWTKMWYCAPRKSLSSDCTYIFQNLVFWTFCLTFLWHLNMEWWESRSSFPTFKITVIESRRTRRLKALEFCKKSLESGKVEWFKRARLRCTEMWKKMKVVNVDENKSCSCRWK